MNKNELNQLLNEVSQITASGLPFMEGKEKIEKDDILGDVLTVDDYGFLEGDEGEYVVIVPKEIPNGFIYGSSVVTQAFKSLDEKFTSEQRSAILQHGLTFRLTEMTSKAKRKYTKIVFNPTA